MPPTGQREFAIRPATASDLADIHRLQIALADHELPFDSNIDHPAIKTPKKWGHIGYVNIGQKLLRDDNYVVVAEAEGRVVGVCYGEVRKDLEWSILDSFGYVGCVFVEKDYRGGRTATRGFGIDRNSSSSSSTSASPGGEREESENKRSESKRKSEGRSGPGETVPGVWPHMLAELERWFRTRGVIQLRLACYVENTKAIKAYERADFRPYQVIMKKNLS